MGKQAEVHIPVLRPSPLTPKRRPFDVGSEVLNPTLCLSSVGVSTGKAFSPALISPAKVHTNLLSMLIANEMTEDMITELLGTGNAAPLMNSLLQPAQAPGLSGIIVDKSAAADGLKDPTLTAQQADVDTSSMRKLIPIAAAEQQEALGAARTVRAKHLPVYLQLKYGYPGALHRPQHVRSTMQVFQPAPPRAGDATGTMVKGLAQRVVGHGSSATAGNPHAVATMAMAHQALRRERQSAAAVSSAATKPRVRGTRAASTGRRPVSAAARLQAGLGGIATAPFATTGREQAVNVGFNVTRTGMAAKTPGPAAYRPQWQALRPSSAAAAVDRCYAAGGRHYEAIRAAVAGARVAGGSPSREVSAGLGGQERSAATVYPSASRLRHPARDASALGATTSQRSPGGGLEQETSDGPAHLGMNAQVHSRCGVATLVHPPAQPQFANAGPGNSACFKVTPRTAAGAGCGRASGSSTPAGVGPGAYVAAERQAPAEQRRPRCDGVAWGRPRPSSAPPAAQQQRHPVVPGPGAYDPVAAASALVRPQSRRCDFSRGSVRPGSAPGFPDARPSSARSVSQHSAVHVHESRDAGQASAGDAPCRVGDVKGKRAVSAGAQGATAPISKQAPRLSPAQGGGMVDVGADGVEDETQAFIYDDDDDDEDGEDGDELDWGGSRDTHVLVAVEGATSAADVRVALQAHGAVRLEGRPTSARPLSGRPPSGRPLSGSIQRAGSAGRASRLLSGNYPATIPEASVTFAEDGQAGAAPGSPPGMADATAPPTHLHHQRQRPVSAAELRASLHAAMHESPDRRGAVGPRAKSASAGVPGQHDAGYSFTRHSVPGEVMAHRDEHALSGGVLVWADTDGGPLVTERPRSAFSNPEMAAEVQRLEWRAARRACAPRSAPAAAGAQQSAAKPQHPQTSFAESGASPRCSRAGMGEGLTAVTPSASAPVSASRRRDHGMKPRPHSSPLLTRHWAAKGSAGQGGEAGAQRAAGNSRIKGVTMAKSTREQSVSGQRLMCAPGVVKPVSAPPQQAVDAIYDPCYTAAGHHRRGQSVTLPRNLHALREQHMRAKAISLTMEALRSL